MDTTATTLQLFDSYIKQIALDCVIFGFHNNELKVLLLKIKMLDNYWMLPSGFIQNTEDVNEALNRMLKDRTGLTDIHLEQFGIFGDVNRVSKNFILNLIPTEHHNDSRINWLADRVITIGYYALVEYSKVKPKVHEFYDEAFEWFNINNLPTLFLDHEKIIQKGLETLRMMLDYKLVGFDLLPETFTMQELQKLYETILGKELRRDSFQRKMLDMNILERLEKKYTGAANKAPYLYRFKDKLSADIAS